MKTLFTLLVALFSLSAFAGPPTRAHVDEIRRATRTMDTRYSSLIDRTSEDTTRARDAYSTVQEDTGFVIGGINDSALIRRLTHLNGIPIANLESRMRPERGSNSGFLNHTESLLEVLQRDNDFVRGNRLSHQVIAQQLRVLRNIINDRPDLGHSFKILYHGIPLQLSQVCTHGSQLTPFHGVGGGLTNDNSSGSCNITITNTQNRREIHFSELLIPMIERYGFYEGSVEYRLNPADILKVLTFLKDSDSRNRPNKSTKNYVYAPFRLE